MIRFSVKFGQFASPLLAGGIKDFIEAFQDGLVDYFSSVLGDQHQMYVETVNTAVALLVLHIVNVRLVQCYSPISTG